MKATLEFGETNVDDAARRCATVTASKEPSLFEAAVRGDIRPESDIDVAVEFEPGARVGLIKFESLAEEWRRLRGGESKRGLKPGYTPRRSKMLVI
jgi:predicted nucleotidyltransferase